MPRTRNSVARLAPFAILPAAVGGCYLWADPIRFSGPAFNTAKEIAPLDVWGVASIAVSSAVVLGLVLRAKLDDARPLSTALLAGGAYYAWWAAVLAFNALQTPTASPTGALFIMMTTAGYFVAAIQTARRATGW